MNRILLDRPAKLFTESLPIGNGRLGAMIFGGVDRERIVINDGTLWSGGPQDSDRPDAAQYVPEIRRLLLAGQNVEAEKLVYEHFTCQGAGSARGHGFKSPYGSYQVLANLHLNFLHSDAAANYRRELNLDNAVARVEFDAAGVHYVRETFASAPDQVIVMRLTASRPGSISFDALLDRPGSTAIVDGTALLLAGQLGEGMRYAARVEARVVGGTGSLSTGIQKADEVVLFISSATDYMGFGGRRTNYPASTAAIDISKVRAVPYKKLLAAHVADYQSLFNRSTLTLGTPNDKPTPERLRTAATDPDLAALYYQYGRYLLIASSRVGCVPANLQGIWADTVDTPWNGDWHLDVNVQMNYWLAEVGNLSELHRPLFALIASLQTPGARTAKLYYNARGWVAHVITNAWGFTSPGEGASWGSTTTGSAWLMQHLWDHYLFTRDLEFLKKAWPILRGAAQFYADMLINEPSHGWLVTAPANSPENSFRMADGKTAHVCMGPTIDNQLLRYLFAACIEASKTLDVDADFRAELEWKITKLPPTRLGSDGRVMEWLSEYAEPEPTHRHVSHLWGLYPGHEITGGPLALGARKSLEARGDISTGWSLAYKVNLWARLGDGNRAYKLLTLLLSPAGATAPSGTRFAGGSYDNLFDSHPPFQIDGNFGAAAGIAEMLLQSHTGAIHLLPALPDAWPEGRVTGLKARGGFTVDIAWKAGKITSAQVVSALGGRCDIIYGAHRVTLDTKPGARYPISLGAR